MVKANGFEGLIGLKDKFRSYRIGHDYDQDVSQNPRETFKDLTKKVLVVTQIRPSSGIEAYERAVISACQSQFKSFSYEFER